MKLILVNLLLLIGSLSFCNDLIVRNNIELDPAINIIDAVTGRTNIEKNRRLYFAKLDGTSLDEVIYTWHLGDDIFRMVPGEEMGFSPTSFLECVWNPQTENHFSYMKFSDTIMKTGWYSYTFSSDDKIEFNYITSTRSWASRNEPSFPVDKNRILSSKYKLEDRNTWESYHCISENGNVIWDMTRSAALRSDVYWVSGDWLLIQALSIIPGIGFEFSLLNYITGEKKCYASEEIIGYGKEVIITSRKDMERYIGITVRSTEGFVLYQDDDLPLSDIIDKDNNLNTIIDFAWYDYPYIYCDTSVFWGAKNSKYTIIMNLVDGSIYCAPLGYHLMGVFSD